MLMSNGLLPARAFTVRIQPARIATSCSSASCYSTAPRPAKIPRTTSTSAFAASKPSSTPSVKISVRYASTAPITSSSDPNAHPPNSPNPPRSSTPTTLTWNRFLELRRKRRKVSVLASSVTAVATVYGGLRVSIENNWDSTVAATVGLDPIIVTGMGVVGFLATGWLIGPFFGNAVFNAWYRKLQPDIQMKERQFYARIKQHRVDPTSSSMANPVPDYYGEKIGSVAGYRRWLKDQRAFNLKRGAYTGSK